MASKKLKRLAMLLPAVLVMSSSVTTRTSALELGASEWVAKILNSLSSQDLGGAQSAADTLRRCGVESIVSGGGEISLEQIDQIIADLKAGNQVNLPGSASGDGSAFIVSRVNLQSVECAIEVVNPEVAAGSSISDSGGPGTPPTSV
jgi:hypothetical protein